MLASAAIIVSAGAAMAQTTTSAPAPTGAPNAPMMTAPNASPGNMAPANGGTTTTPYYSGQNSIKTSTATGTTPGNMAPPAADAQPQPRPMKAMMTYSHSAAMPQNADVRTYLHIAADAIRHHDKATADDALSHAETRLLTRAVPASSGPAADDSPAVTAIEHARQALAAGDYPTAGADTKMAMHAHHGMMGM
jgi:hypothetical protein